jgi:hypothetical protein
LTFANAASWLSVADRVASKLRRLRLGVFAVAPSGDLGFQTDGPIAAAAPRVSVILPARDGGAYLADAVASILAQSFADLELLLIDDGSRDGAVAALAPLAARDPRLRLLANPGAGLVAALNFGLGQARGELVARMDADDVARPERLARQVAFLDASPDVALVGAQVAFIDAAGAPTGERSYFPTAPAAVAAALAARGCVIRHPTIVARKAALLAAGGYRAPCERAEDYDLWLRLSERARLANLPKVLLAYRVHGGQTSAGINLDQRFARDLALLAARARRTGRPDPLDGVGEALRFDRPPPAGWRPPASVAALISAYGALAWFEGRGEIDPPDRSALAALVACAREGLLGDGRRYRALALCRCARLAARSRDWRFAAQAAALALWIAPGRAARGLALGPARPGRRRSSGRSETSSGG